MGAGFEDAAEIPRDGAAMESGLSQRRAYREFAAAVVAFSEDPSPGNLERYLAASKALEESYGRPIVRRTGRARAAR